MLGWEFPPLISGGLGTACEGLSRALAELGASVLFLLPGPETSDQAPLGKLEHTAHPGGQLGLQRVFSSLRTPYPGSAAPSTAGHVPPAPASTSHIREPGLYVIGTGTSSGYQGDLAGRIAAYADRCLAAVQGESFDVIHAHDWLTFPAAKRIAEQTGTPWCAHIHATEFDRSGETVNQGVYDAEREGVHTADAVFTVSHFTKQILIAHYAAKPEKVHVVHNGIRPTPRNGSASLDRDPRPTALFVGRLTWQKAPHIFVQAAERVLERVPNARFVFAGKGELAPHLVEEVAARGLGQAVFFTGFLPRAQLSEVYRQADVCVMPSVSEPFGLTALEGLQHGVPAIVSKSAGVAEVLDGGAIKVDWWDVEKWAEAMTAVMTDSTLAARLRSAGQAEAATMTWHRTATCCLRSYRSVMNQ
jgi:glycosyltransferase involved in cell wall biosynthesis